MLMGAGVLASEVTENAPLRFEAKHGLEVGYLAVGSQRAVRVLTRQLVSLHQIRNHDHCAAPFAAVAVNIDGLVGAYDECGHEVLVRGRIA